jgi:hypothetical protein
MELAEIRQRVKDTGLYGSVEDAVSFAHAMNSGIGNSNARAWVIVSSERAEPDRTIGGSHRQRVNMRISVLFVVQAASARTQDRSDLIEAHKAALKSKLAGFTPTGAAAPMQYLATSIRDLSKGLIWTEALFEAGELFEA